MKHKHPPITFLKNLANTTTIVQTAIAPKETAFKWLDRPLIGTNHN